MYAPSKFGLVIFAAFIFFWAVSIFQHPLFLTVLAAVSLWLIISRKKITPFPFALLAISLGVIMFGTPQAKPFTNADNAIQKPVIPFAYLKGTYRGNLKGTYLKDTPNEAPYSGVDYSVDGNNDYPIKTYCGLSDYQKDPDQQYYTLDKVKLFNGVIKMRCSYSGLGSLPSYICNIYHPIATDAHIRIAFNTAYDVPKDQWDSFFANLAKHIESQIPKNEMPDIEQICRQLKNQFNTLPTEK
jgi:hypothetical protein